MTRTTKTTFLARFLAVGVVALVATACYARVDSGDREECRTYVRNKGEVEQCHSHCHDDRCHTECQEHERQSRERHCWVD